MTAGGLSARGLTIVRPDGKAILRGAALDIGPSEVVLLAGPSGCGKSTLLSLLGGILDADGGGWTVAGTLVRDGEETDLAAGPAQAGGVVFQSHALFDELDARSNLRIARDHAPGGSVAAERDILPMLADIDPRQSVGASSGGQRQRLAIARTVLADHPVLLLDEPNAGLDIVSSRRLVELIRGLCRTMGKPALIAVHHASELLPLADRVLVMDPTTAELAEVAPDAAALEARLARAAGAEALAADAAAPAADAARWRLGGGWAPRRSHGAWMAHYAATYLWLLCASPIMLVYVGAGAAITGFVTIWYGFNYYSFGGLLRSALHDETLVGLGTVQSRVALPMIVTILFVARNSAVVAADIGNRALTRQFAAMDNLGIPGRLYIYGGIALAMVAGAVLSLVLALLLGAWAAQETWLFQFPTQHRELFRGLYFRNVLTDAGWPVAAMGWAVAKVAISAALAAAASIAIASGPKESSQAVSRAVADAIVAGTLIALGVHAAISALTAVR